jgi:Tol biopolymer transport system component
VLRVRAALLISLASITIVCAAVAAGRMNAPATDVLAYASDHDIWVADIARGLTHNLTNDEDRIVDNTPSWAPDGRRLVFATVRNAPNSRPHSEIALLDIATREVVLLTETTTWDDSPAWSPDGRWIAFRSDRDTHAGMGVYLIEPSRPLDPPRLLVRDLHVDLIPSWSPDSTAVVMTLTIGDNTQVIAVDIDAGTGTQLLPRTAYHPRLSPDGTLLAVWLPAVDGYALAVGKLGETPAAVSGAHMNPSLFAWSPDGRAIAYGSTENARSVIKRVDIETGATSILFSTPAYVSGVSWRP